MDADDLPEPDRTAPAPHPRHTFALFGHGAAEAAFLEAFTSGRLHHGWLLTGPKGIGKATLAWRIARFLLAQPAEDGGGLFGDAPPPDTLEIAADHPAARRVAALSDPGLFLMRRPWDEKAKRLKTEITVAEVRKLTNFLTLSATDGGRRVILVDAADEMNRSAANALLKMLEEPPARTTILLISHQPGRLLPTIRSRCRSLALSPLSDGDLSAALDASDLSTTPDPATLALAQGSAGRAHALLEGGGAELYGTLVSLWSGGRMDRPRAIALCDTMGGVQARPRLEMFVDLAHQFLSRTARAGLMGPPQIEAAPEEARVLARLSPHDHAARQWARLATEVDERLRHGLAVNLDPEALVFDMLAAIDAEARRIAPA